jgi:ABC-2 type transport system ATP-binding protein
MALVAPEPIPPAVEMRAVVKSFGRPWRPPWRRRAPDASRDKVALRGIDLEVITGKITGIIGPNGSGKSTLIRILATLIVPDAGEARVFGYDVVAEPLQVRRHVNRVSVEAAFFKEMSPWENMVYAARLYGGGGDDTRSRVESILERLGLPLSTLDRPMKQLSRGQQQKVAIARSLLTSPALLLMDEPTTGLDPRSKREVQALLTMLREEHAATVLLCTHDLAEAEALCDQVVILENGEILVQGPPRELCRRYTGTTLEDVYLRLSGKAFADEDKDEDSE